MINRTGMAQMKDFRLAELIVSIEEANSWAANKSFEHGGYFRESWL